MKLKKIKLRTAKDIKASMTEKDILKELGGAEIDAAKSEEVRKVMNIIYDNHMIPKVAYIRA